MILKTWGFNFLVANIGDSYELWSWMQPIFWWHHDAACEAPYFDLSIYEFLLYRILGRFVIFLAVLKWVCIDPFVVCHNRFPCLLILYCSSKCNYVRFLLSAYVIYVVQPLSCDASWLKSTCLFFGICSKYFGDALLSRNLFWVAVVNHTTNHIEFILGYNT